MIYFILLFFFWLFFSAIVLEIVLVFPVYLLATPSLQNQSVDEHQDQLDQEKSKPALVRMQGLVRMS